MKADIPGYWGKAFSSECVKSWNTGSRVGKKNEQLHGDIISKD